jgi:hypothetical protein
MTDLAVPTLRRKPLIVAGLILLAAVGPIVWLYAGGAEHPIYWLLVSYPAIACITGIVAFGVLGWIGSRAVVISHGRIAVVILVVACSASAFGCWIGIWNTPNHNHMIRFHDHVYYVAVHPLNDISNPYYLYQCDSLGLYCTLVQQGTVHPDIPLRLSVDERMNRIVIMQGAEIDSTYEPPE